MSKVIWRTIPSFENFQISSEGQVRNKQTLKVSTRTKNAWGTLSVRFPLHTAEEKPRYTYKIIRNILRDVFLPRPEKGQWILTFRDGNEENLTVDNMCWAHGRQRRIIYFDVHTEHLQEVIETEESKKTQDAAVKNEEEQFSIEEPEADADEIESVEQEIPESNHQYVLVKEYYDEVMRAMAKMSSRLDDIEEKLQFLPREDKELLEVWKDIPIEPDYQASSFGQIRNAKTKDIISQRKSVKEDAMIVILHGSFQYEVSELVLNAFQPYLWSAGKKDVVYIDGDIENCRVENLEVYYDGKKAIRQIRE